MPWLLENISPLNTTIDICRPRQMRRLTDAPHNYNE
jgi:hypothetical protein